MTTHHIAETIQSQQGWTDATLLDLCLSYIDNQQSPDAFTDYLRTVAEEENDGRDSNDLDACLALGTHLHDVDDDGYCNHCGFDTPTPGAPAPAEDEDDRDRIAYYWSYGALDVLAGRRVTEDEARRIARALDHSTAGETLEAVVEAVCGTPDDEDEGDE